ncbi:High cysteine membrane protein Group 1 [Giardia lamblia P15]|uniref:High cysteine membrane protein Group 1 n=1 Tax=Giardia intestinalis (strain P15) TaxID=658858 RepID=E1F5I5_GIAIA|nr:High cysteine membrane protein Group 1 [Giardia lamblia P15]
MMLVPSFFGILAINQAIWADDSSIPYMNNYYVACGPTHTDCVKNKCVMFDRGTTLCTECKSGKVPINGVCVETGNDSSVDTSICVTTTNNSGTTGRCVSCTDGKKTINDDPDAETTYFLFYGGCYSKDEWPGSRICMYATKGDCQYCDVEYGAVFTNSQTDAEEKCILCGDTVGFNGKVGMDGCSTCASLSKDPAPNNAASTASIQCTSCLDDSKAPIDGVCAAFGSNKCENGYCTHCSTNYIYHKGGCYNKTEKGNTICDPANQFEIIGYSACKKCANSSEVPHNGNCKPLGRWNSCKKDASEGKCTACNRSSPGRNIFFYEGGCYNINDPLGNTICIEAFNGKCTTCREENGYFKRNGTCNSCNASITDCASCLTKYNDPNTIMCIGCKNNKYAAVGGASCLSTCPAENPGSCDESNICRCNCGSGTYLSTTTNSCIACDSACADCTGSGANSCISCASGKYMKYGTSDKICVDLSECGDGYYVDTDSRSCFQCGIEKCQTCAFNNNRVMCTKCSQGLISVNSSLCVSQCTGPNQQVDAGVRCICVEGFEPNSDGVCVSKNTCPSDTIGCSSCNTDGECLSCSNGGYNVQPNKRSCASGCPSGSESVGSLCICMEGYTLKGDTCILQTRKASSSSTTIAVIVALSILVVVVVVLTCWFVLRKRRGSKVASKRRAASDNIELMGNVDEF